MTEHKIPWELVSLLIILGTFGWWALGYLLGRLCTQLSIALANTHKVLAFPTARSSHTVPTPRIGGIGIFVPFVVLTVIELAIFTYAGVLSEKQRHALSMLLPLLTCGCLFFLLGLIDDLWETSAKLKLLWQVVLVAAAVALGVRLDHFILPGEWVVRSATLGYLTSFLWLLFFINAFNFMDGMDGKAACFTINFCVMAMLMLMMSLMPVWKVAPQVILLMGLMGVSTGFLHYNRSPARTFMGDCGSMFLGFLLGGFLLLAGREGARHISPVAFFILLLPFTYDVLYTLLRRWQQGETLMQAHRSHLYQRLMLVGYSHPRILRLVARDYVACGIMALIYSVVAIRWIQLLAFACAVLMMVRYNLFVLREERTKGEQAETG